MRSNFRHFPGLEMCHLGAYSHTYLNTPYTSWNVSLTRQTIYKIIKLCMPFISYNSVRYRN